MTLPKVTPGLVIGGTLGVIAVALGVQVISKRDEPSRPPMLGENGRGQYGRKDHDKKKHKDRDHKKKKKHKHHDDD